LVANLGAYLALERGRRVLAIDMDPQGQLGKVLGIDVRAVRRSAIDLLLDEMLDESASLDEAPFGTDAGALPRLRSRIAGLDLVVANKSLALYASSEGPLEERTRVLRHNLESARETRAYDLVLMDAPPSFGTLTLNVLRAATEVVIPVPLTFLALDGCAELLRTIQTVRSQYGNPGLRVSMVIPTFYRKTRMAQEVLDRLSDRFPKELCQTVLGFHVKVDEAQSRGLSLFEYAPKDKGARAMAAVAEELLMRDPGASVNP